MSRFFAAGYTSDTSSEEEDLLSTSEEELVSSSEEFSTDSEFENDSDELSSDDEGSDYDARGPSYFLKKDFLKSGRDDLDLDSDNEGRKVVKSAKDKLLDDMRESVDLIYNQKNLDNWSSVLTELDRLGRLLVRANQQNVGVPNFYYKMLGQLEDTINETTSDKEKRKLPADQNRALNTVRQRVKKLTKEFAPYLALYREDPSVFDSEEPVELPLEQSAADNAAASANAEASRVVSPVFVTLRLVAETRGKKNIDKFEQLSILESLLEDAKKSGNVFELISVYQMLLSVRFDAASNQTYMPLELWAHSEKDVNEFLTLLEQNAQTYQVSEKGVSTDDLDIEPAANAQGVKVILGSVSAIVERLDDEFTRYLQNTDPHSIEYIERLKDGSALYKLIVRAQVYVELTTGSSEYLARMVLRRLDHIYYKPDQLIQVNEELAWKSYWEAGVQESSLVTKGKAPAEVISAIYAYLVKQDSFYEKHALLAYTYYQAVNNRYAEARELFLSSQIYTQISLADSSVQVLYNRALVQLGLSAFRAGEIEESHQILTEISYSLRVKELLGQGFNSKYPSQATPAEKQKLLPFHMHINLELLECVFMTASLLIEIPALAAASNSSKDSKKKASIRLFKSKLEFHERQYFTGPPESIKDHLIYASRYLQKGQWAKSYELLLSIKIWKLFPDNAALLQMLKNQLQVEGLRTYIFSYKSIFSKLSVKKLAEQFQLEASLVSEIVTKMFESGDIQGSIESDFINFATDEPQRSKLQELAIIMNEKVGLLNEKNEKTASNGRGRKQDFQQQQQQQQQQKEQKEILQEENNKFRYASVNANNDEFQVTA